MRGKLRILSDCARGERRRFAAAAVALIGTTALAYVPPLLIRYTIDGVISGRDDAAPAWLLWLVDRAGGAAALAERLWWVALALILVSAMAGGLNYLHGRWAAYGSERMTRRLRDRLYDRLHHLPCRFFDRAETGDLVQRCTTDVEVLRTFLGTQVVELFRAGVMIALALPILFWLDWRMALAAICMLPIIAVFTTIFFLKVRGTFDAVEDAEAVLTTCLQENLTGVRVVRAFGRQDYETKKFTKLNETYRAAHWRLYRILGYFWSLSDLFVFVQMATVLFTGAWLVMRGPAAGGITIGTLVAFLSYVMMYIWPVRQMGRILAEMSKSLVSLDRIAHILDAELEEPTETPYSQPAAPVPTTCEGRIEFREVCFSHGPAPVLRSVSLSVEPGQTLAILGPSGCGKTTVVQLLLRFYDYDSGSILLDGRELRELPRKIARGFTGAVLQEPFLYSRTLRDNIALGESQIGHERIVEASTAACVHETIERFEAGYDTLIGERGITLSGGQRQRVALARAILRNPAILILDDAFSAVDTRTEAMILRTLRRRHGKQTTIVIAHRLTTVMHADQILVMEGGRVTQQGTHEQLIAAEGLYRRLWQLQQAEAEDALQSAVQQEVGL